MVSLSLRFRVLQRDQFICQYCGAAAPDVALEVDHRWPRARGGSDDIENLVAACQACNRGKGAAVLDDARADMSEAECRAALAAARARVLRAFEDDRGDVEMEWGMATGHWLAMSSRDEAVVADLIVTHGITQVLAALRLSASARGHDADHECPLVLRRGVDVCPQSELHGRPLVGEIKQTLRRWRRDRLGRSDPE